MASKTTYPRSVVVDFKKCSVGFCLGVCEGIAGWSWGVTWRRNFFPTVSRRLSHSLVTFFCAFHLPTFSTPTQSLTPPSPLFCHNFSTFFSPPSFPQPASLQRYTEYNSCASSSPSTQAQLAVDCARNFEQLQLEESAVIGGFLDACSAPDDSGELEYEREHRGECRFPNGEFRMQSAECKAWSITKDSVVYCHVCQCFVAWRAICIPGALIAQLFL